MAQTATVSYLAPGAASVTASCEGVNSASVGVTVVAATPAARILSYLSGLPGQTSHRCIVGQMMENASPQLSGINQLFTDTGKYVGLYGTAYTYDLGSLNNNVSTMWGRGSLITGICTFKNPQTGGAETDTTAAVHNAITSGTAANSNFFGTQLPALAATLKSLVAAVPGVCLIIRPFREANGNWFWYSAGLSGTSLADWLALWRQTHDYLVNTPGLTGSLLFDWNVSAGIGNYTTAYPGTAYVDVVSFDFYGNSPATGAASAYTSLLGLGKPIHWAEFGCNNSTSCPANSFDSTVVLNAVKNTFPKCFAVSTWNNGWAWDTQLNASTVMNDTVIATATDVHAGTR